VNTGRQASPATTAPDRSSGPDPQEPDRRPAGGRSWSSPSAYRIASFSLREAGIGIALVLVCVIFALTAQRFASPANVLNILVQVSINTVLAVGMTFVILVGGIDLSVGSILALGTVFGAQVLIDPSRPLWLAVSMALGACLLAGLFAGLLNGYISERWRVPSFIVTLGMLNVARGGAAVASDNSTISGLPLGFVNFGTRILLGVVPMIFLLALVTVVIAWFVLRRTVFGRLVYAVGTNEEAVRLSGHDTRRIKVTCFAISGACAGLAAVVFLLRLNVGSPTAGVGYELTAIAAVILGGTALTGGRGSVIGTFLGACLLQVLTTGLQLLGVGDNFRLIVVGSVIVAAVVLDTYRERLLAAINRRATASTT
jgi:ribose transport system permease protein